MSKISLNEDTKFFVGLKDAEGQVDEENLQEIKPVIIDDDQYSDETPKINLPRTPKLDLLIDWKSLVTNIASQIDVSFVSQYWRNAIETHKFSPKWWQSKKLDMKTIKVNWGN